MIERAKLDLLSRELTKLKDSQIDWLASIVAQFNLPQNFWFNPQSNLLNQAWLEHFGNILMVHHAMSDAPFSKEKFEFGFIFATRKAGIPADKPTSRTNRGHDVTVNGTPMSLKTQADKNICEDMIHISKFMELGKGEWSLPTLRGLFFKHMQRYERIFTLRALSDAESYKKYELVEIPKALLLGADRGEFEVKENSKQVPKPGYCRVIDKDGSIRFELYFDGGTERKLQIRKIRKELCTVHAIWEFETTRLFDI